MTQLAPPRLVGLVLGVWFLAAAWGNKLAGILGGGYTATDPQRASHLLPAAGGDGRRRDTGAAAAGAVAEAADGWRALGAQAASRLGVVLHQLVVDRVKQRLERARRRVQPAGPFDGLARGPGRVLVQGAERLFGKGCVANRIALVGIDGNDGFGFGCAVFNDLPARTNSRCTCQMVTPSFNCSGKRFGSAAESKASTVKRAVA